MKRQTTVASDALGATRRSAERPITVVVVTAAYIVDVDAVTAETSQSRVEDISRHHF